MFEALPVQPGDPILQLMQDARLDTNPDKLDLSVGVYCDEQAKTPVMRAVKEAESRLLAEEQTKAYLGVAGDPRFNALVTSLALGEQHPALVDQRVGTIQTTGGSGAIRIAAELVKQITPGARVWVSTPTWGNHIPLLGAAGLEVSPYPYYDPAHPGVNFNAMCEALQNAQAGEVLLLQAGCHNPTGADLTFDQWRHLTGLVQEKGLLPLVDAAYQGMGSGFEEDARGFRHMAENVSEMLITYSCSKNFGLYRDRAGALISISSSAEHAVATLSNLMSISRVVYSMPPAHGAWLAAEVLADPALRSDWLGEVEVMRKRIAAVRRLLSAALAEATASNRFDFIATQQGMFSFLGLNPDQVRALREEFSIYMLTSSRINIAGATDSSAGRFAGAVAEVLSRT